MEHIVFVNRGTQDCKAVILWLKEEMSDAHIVSISLENDPFINMESVMNLVSQEGLEHITIPFDHSLIATKNQNIERAWEFERHFKALQFQRSRALYVAVDCQYVVTSLKGAPEEKELVKILQDYTRLHAYAQVHDLKVESYIVHPLETIIGNEELMHFLGQEDEVIK